MNLFRRPFLALGLPLLSLLTCRADNRQQEGEKIIGQAEQISNIRSLGASAFRLKASFRALGEKAPAEVGTYTEIWVSRGRWRREIVLGDFHRTEVGDGPKKRWILDSVQEVPEKAGDLGTLMRMPDFYYEGIKVKAIHDQRRQDLQVRCVEVKADSGGDETLCFDPERGVLLQKNALTVWKGSKAEYSCQYGNYEQFAGRMYPRHIECTKGKHLGIDVTVLELTSLPLPDATLLDPPFGAKELADCSGKMQPPGVLQSPDPAFPRGEAQPNLSEVLRMTVDVDGQPHDVRVVRSIGGAFDKPALEATSRWRFKPAICEGDPVPVQINVEIVFRRVQ